MISAQTVEDDLDSLSYSRFDAKENAAERGEDDPYDMSSTVCTLARFRMMSTGRDHLTDDDTAVCVRAYLASQRRVLRCLRGKRTWRAVTALANALLAKHQLTGEEVEAIVDLAGGPFDAPARFPRNLGVE